MKNPVSALVDKMSPERREQVEKAIKVTAGTAAAIWVVLRLKRELYGPGGTRMSRYDTSVDKIWHRD